MLSPLNSGNNSGGNIKNVENSIGLDELEDVVLEEIVAANKVSPDKKKS